MSIGKKLNIKDKKESFLAFKKKPNNTQRIFKSSISGLHDIKIADMVMRKAEKS